MKTILFICRGNAFRSIMAEAYLKSKQLPNILVLSAGTVATEHKLSNVDGFKKVQQLLNEHDIDKFAKNHYADDLTQTVLDSADLVVFLNIFVKEEALKLGFNLPKNYLVWDVSDIGEPGRTPTNSKELIKAYEDTYEEITVNTDALIASNNLTNA